MSKAILVMDMPEQCISCPFCVSDCSFRDAGGCEHFHEGFRCLITGHKGAYIDKPVKCPLVPAIGYVQPVGHVVSWEDDSDE